jgi:hypothetical protein
MFGAATAKREFSSLSITGTKRRVPRMTGKPSNPRARGSKAALTPTQRRLINELEEIAASIGMDYWNIVEYRQDGRTALLE